MCGPVDVAGEGESKGCGNRDCHYNQLSITIPTQSDGHLVPPKDNENNPGSEYAKNRAAAPDTYSVRECYAAQEKPEDSSGKVYEQKGARSVNQI